jgi:hypothetical protein
MTSCRHLSKTSEMSLRGSGGDENGAKPRHTAGGGTGVPEVVKAAVPRSPKNTLTRVRSSSGECRPSRQVTRR